MGSPTENSVKVTGWDSHSHWQHQSERKFSKCERRRQGNKRQSDACANCSKK